MIQRTRTGTEALLCPSNLVLEGGVWRESEPASALVSRGFLRLSSRVAVLSLIACSTVTDQGRRERGPALACSGTGVARAPPQNRISVQFLNAHKRVSAPAGNSVPQAPHERASRRPHSGQNLASSGFSCRHWGQRLIRAPLAAYPVAMTNMLEETNKLLTPPGPACRRCGAFPIGGFRSGCPGDGPALAADRVWACRHQPARA
jgi:hypothetical protein